MKGGPGPPRGDGPGRVFPALPALLLLLLSSCSAIFGDSAPQREGTLAVPGLAAPVEILRDRYGIPHIAAQSDRDLYFAQGFVHAQDRLFQMDLERRLARGELAEIFGEEALPADRLFRHMGFSARAPGLVASWPERSRAIARSYCEGVNAAMELLSAWPAEHRILSAPPRPFTPEDVAVAGLLKSFWLAQWFEEAALYRACLVLPREQAEELLPAVLSGSPVVDPRFGPAGPGAPSPEILTRGLASVRRTLGDFPRAGGSNAWAVSGKKSATGRPILASDPHLLLSCPSLFYENHLVAPGVDVYGVSFPGAPCVVIGHNPQIAWGMTNAMLDDADFFVERMSGDNVMVRGRWTRATVRRERILVRGGKEEILSARETPHGPIVSPALPGIGKALSLRWTGFDGGDSIGALHDLNRARGRGEFLASLAAFPHPAQNVVYADREGNIGVAMAGRIPVRKGGAGLLPVPGDTGEWDWKGTVPFAGNPGAWNPPEQFVVAANFPPAGRAYPHYLSRIYEPPDRGLRIARLLSAREKFSVDKFERMQVDVLRPEAAPAVTLAIAAARKRQAADPRLGEAARILSEWDLCAATDSVGASLYEAFYEKMIENAFRDDLGPELFEECSRASRILWNAMDRVLARGDSAFLKDGTSGRKESLDELAARSLGDAMALLKGRLGNVPSTWGWGRLHQVAFEHPFGRNRFLKRWFDIGPSAVPGDGRTVWKEEYRHGTDFRVTSGPVMRQVVPLGFRPMARSVITTGASGHFFEPHYADQAPLWLAGKMHPAWTAREDIEANAAARLRLVPKAAAPPSP